MSPTVRQRSSAALGFRLLGFRLWGFRLALTIAATITLVPSSKSQEPLWKQGIATFNGVGYDFPVAESDAFPLPVVAPETNFDPQGAVDSEIEVAQYTGPPMPTAEDFLKDIEKATPIETMPLQSEVLHWYDYPRRWMDDLGLQGWDSHAELGLDGSSGNADTLAIQTGFEIKRKTKQHTLQIDLEYRQASSGRLTTEDNGRLNVDYDRHIAETPWSAFNKFGLEWDAFKAFDLRMNANGGVGYHWLRSDEATLVTRLGAGASKEFGSPDDDWSPEAVFGISAERRLSKRQKLKGKIDYFPTWEDFNDYRIVADASWEMLIDGSENLSLKISATDRYDSTPQGARPNDVYYSILLLYKF